MKENNLRIAIVGTSGSGKSTLAKRVSDILDCDHIELDNHMWLPNWEKNKDEVYLESVSKACARERWVSCGNYSQSRDVVWKGATHLIWLRLPFVVVFWQVLKRTVKRIWKKEPIAGGNVESFWLQFFTRKSILLWVIQTHWRRRRIYEKLIEEGIYAPLKVIVLRSRKEVNHFIKLLEKGEGL